MTTVVRIIRPIILLSYLSLGVVISAYSQGSNIKFIEQYKSAPNHISKSPTKLVEYLTNSESSNAQKAFSIYVWMVNNIKYDLKATKKVKVKKHTAKQTLRRKKGINSEYANLFTNLCDIANVPSRPIVGYYRELNYSGEPFYEANYIWNALKIDSSWQLLDVTLGAGFAVQKQQKFKRNWSKLIKKPFINNKYEFFKEPNYKYFDINPQNYIANHLPVDPTWQLVKYPVSLKSFENENWVGYKNEKDMWEPKTIASSEYSSLLAKNEFLSPRQYFLNTAEISNEVNPLNFELLARYYYLSPSSIYLFEKNVQFANANFLKAIAEYRSAILYANKHSRVVKSESKKNIKRVEHRGKKELLKPIQNISKKSETQLKIKSKFLSKKENKVAKKTKICTALKEDISSLKKPPLKQTKTLGEISLTQTQNNNNLLQENKALISQISDSIILIKEDIKFFLKEKSLVQENLVLLNEKLNGEVLLASLLIEGNRSAKDLKRATNSLVAQSLVIDSLNGEEIKLGMKISSKERILVEKTREISKLARFSIKLIQDSCVDALNCNISAYNFFFNVIRFKLQSNLDSQLLILKMIINDYEYFEKLNGTLGVQIDNLDSYQKMVSYYILVKKKGFSLERDRSLYEMDRIVKQSNNRIRVISAKKRRVDNKD